MDNAKPLFYTFYTFILKILDAKRNSSRIQNLAQLEAGLVLVLMCYLLEPLREGGIGCSDVGLPRDGHQGLVVVFTRLFGDFLLRKALRLGTSRENKHVVLVVEMPSG